MFKQRCKISSLTAAAILSLGLPASQALALTLGSMRIQSSLGEPLRAEVHIPELSTEEAETLSVDVAPPAVFLTQGLEYTAAASNIRITVQRREDGSAVLRLNSTQTVNEPFFDVVIDANWAGGNLRRNYTMLLSPPVLRPPPTAIAPQVPADPVAAAPAGGAGAASGDGERDFTSRAPAVTGGPGAAPDAGADGGTVQVKRGDTAGRIAAAHLPAGVSLEQMLMAMLRANPDAFIRGNVNLMRAGAVLTLPDAAAAQNTPPREARQMLAAQTRDFNQYRRNLAQAAPTIPAAPPSSSTVTGSIPTLVETPSSPPPSPDRLILGGGTTGTANEQLTAAQLQERADADRLRELQENLSALSNIAAATPSEDATTAPPPPPPPAQEQPPAQSSAPPAIEPVDAATPPSGNASGGEAADKAPAAPVQQGAGKSPARPPAPPRPPLPPPPPPSLLDTLMEDPILPLAAGGVLVLLLGYGGYRVVQRRRATAALDETAFGSSELDDESFYDSGGGKQVNTDASEQTGNTSSLFYSPSQLDAGDVDPVAEADVYLAYGRDKQAEEILREALRLDQSRPSLHLKLSEIYAKRNDRKAFAGVAQTLHDLTQGKGPEWESLAGTGRTLDPENPLYHTSGTKPPPAPTPVASAAEAGPSTTQFFVSTANPPQSAAQPPQETQTHFAPPAPTPPPPAAAAADNPASLFKGGLPSELSLDDFLSNPTPTPAPAPAEPAAAPPAERVDSALELDLNLSLDSSLAANAASPAASSAPDAAQEDPLGTKVELAKEFNAIGDTDGARALLEEVVAEAPDDTHPAKVQAKHLLAQMA